MATEMDPISKALERAQRDGRSVRNWVAPAGREAVRPEMPAVAARLVELDPDLLAGHNILSGPDHEDPVIADRYRLLRTQLLTRMQAHGWSKLGITSSGPKAGKTLTSINLALSIARDGSQHVALIDADLRKASIAGDLGLNGDIGLIDYLTSDLPLEAVAVTPRNMPNLMIVPGRRIDSSSATPEALRTAKMQNLVKSFGADTIVIVDLPPVVVGDDVITVAAHLDGMLLVIAEGATDVEELQQAARLLADYNLLGSVLNKSMEKTREVEGYYQKTPKKRRRRSKSRQE